MVRLLTVCLLAALLTCLTGCFGCFQRDNPDALREKTAEATARIKRDAGAVASGVREGISSPRMVDLNTASRDQLSGLPGISENDADKIIESRPYNSSQELVTRRVISKKQYEQIQDRVTAKR